MGNDIVMRSKKWNELRLSVEQEKGDSQNSELELGWHGCIRESPPKFGNGIMRLGCM